MMNVAYVRRLIDLGVSKYHTMCPIVLGKQAFLVIGEVQDLANTYVCLRLGPDDVVCEIKLLVLGPEADAYSIDDIDIDKQLMMGSERQSIDCTMASALVGGMFQRIESRVPPTMADRLQAINVLTRNMLRVAWAAGIFTGKHAHKEAMAYGAHVKLPPASKRSRLEHELADARRGCKVDDKQGILTYAEVLITAKAYENLFLSDEL